MARTGRGVKAALQMMNPFIEFDEIILEATKLLGRPVDKKRYELVDRGMPHEPKMLPPASTGTPRKWAAGVP